MSTWLVNGLMRHAADPDAHPLTGGRLILRRQTFEPFVDHYNCILRSTPADYGDFRPVFVAAQAWRKDRLAGVYDPSELEHGLAAFVYPPLPALALSLIADNDRPLADAAFLVHNVNRLFWLMGGIFLLLIYIHPGRVAAGEASVLSLAYIAFYPLAEGLFLTQLQITVWIAVVLAAFLLQRRFYTASGLAMSVAICIKPHLALVPLILAFSRSIPKRWLIACLGASAGIAGVCVLWVGWRNCMDYVTIVLPSLSAGYAYYPNQSLNGVLLRLGDYAPAAVFTLAPAVAWIKTVGWLVLASLVIGTSVVVRRCSSSADRMVVFAVAVTTATLASPVTWFHHFTLLSIGLIVLARSCLRAQVVPSRYWPWLVLLSYLLIGSYFDGRALNGMPAALASGLGLYGVILLYVLLIRLSFLSEGADVRGDRRVSHVPHLLS